MRILLYPLSAETLCRVVSVTQHRVFDSFRENYLNVELFESY